MDNDWPCVSQLNEMTRDQAMRLVPLYTYQSLSYYPMLLNLYFHAKVYIYIYKSIETIRLP